MKKNKLLKVIFTLFLMILTASALFITIDAEEAFEYDCSSITTESALNTMLSELTSALNNGATDITLSYGDLYYLENYGASEKIYFNKKVNQAIKDSSAADGSIELTINGKYGGHVWMSLSDNSKLTTVSLPDSIVLASELFKNCTNLTYVYAPKAYNIGNNVFKGCTALGSVILTTSENFDFIESQWDDIFGGTSSNVNLAINCNKSSDITENTWKTMQFKSIVYAHNSVSCSASSASSINGYCNVCKKSVFTLTLTAPENLIYDGLEKTAVVNCDLALLNIPEIVYKKGTTVLSAPPTDAGNYTATITLGSATASVSFTIQKKTVTVTAENKTVCIHGDLSYSYIANGFIGNDNFIKEPTLESSADTEIIGEYPISISGAVVSDNYDIKYVNGSLTVKNHEYSLLQKYDVDLHKKVCECGDFIYEDHDWNKGEITKPASCTESGEKLFTCTIYSETTIEEIPMLTHADNDNDEKCDECLDDLSDKDESSTDNKDNTEDDNKNSSEKSTDGSNENASNNENDNSDATNVTDATNNENNTDTTDNKNSNDKSDNSNESTKKNDDSKDAKRGCNGCDGCRSSASISAILAISIIGAVTIIKKKED